MPDLVTRTPLVVRIPLACIRLDPALQPRRFGDLLHDPAEVERMATAGRAAGFIDGVHPDWLRPLVVRRDDGDGRYDLIAGYHRCALLVQAGRTEAPCEIKDIDRLAAVRLARRSNLETKALAPLEEAAIFRAMIDDGQSPEEIAAELDRRSPEAVARRAALDYLSPALRAAVERRELRVEYAEAIGEAARAGASPAFQGWLRDRSRLRGMSITVFRAAARRLVSAQGGRADGEGGASGGGGQGALFDMPPDAAIEQAEAAFAGAAAQIATRDRWRRLASAGRAVLRHSEVQPEVVVRATEEAARQAAAIDLALSHEGDLVGGGEAAASVALAVAEGDARVETPVAASPILKWAGSKRALLPEILPRLRGPAGDGMRLVEPFAGGAAVTLALAPSRGLLSDACAPLIALYAAVQSDPRAVWEAAQALLAIPPDPCASAHIRREVSEAEARYFAIRAMQPGDGVLAAARLLYLNRACFNGLYRENRAGRFNVPASDRTRKGDPPVLPPLSDLVACARALEGVEVRRCVWEETLAEAGAGDVVYADPPYEGCFDGYGVPWSVSDHDALAEALCAAADRGALVVASQLDTEAVRRRYGWCERLVEIALPKGYAMDRRKQAAAAGELLCLSSGGAGEAGSR